MTDISHLVSLLTVLLLAVFVGFEVISKVPTTFSIMPLATCALSAPWPRNGSNAERGSPAVSLSL